jgi:cytochrome c556
MKRVLGAAVAFACMATAGTAMAQQKPEDVIKFRKSLYTVVAWNVRPIGQMVKGEVPFNKDVFARSAAMVAQLAQIAPEAFAAGSDKGAETRAKPEIWSDAAGFKKAVDAFQSESAKLAEVSRTATTVDQVRAQAGALLKTCGGCHDTYRTK